jgi:hypothetical protein
MIFNLIFFNRYFDKNRLKSLVLWSLTRSGEKTTIDLVEKLKDIGFHYATQAGLSLSIDDLKIPPSKPKLILEAELIVQSSQKDYEIGNLTVIERFQQMIDVWHRTSEVLKQNVVQHFRSTNILNPVYMMAFSGARGNISQVRQLVGMRGLMADPQGQILDFPIRSNFREGLTLTEYVISCYGARKGLVDTALRTANSGYLTRRLVDVAQHIIVRQLDCGTNGGIVVTDMKDGKKIILSLQKRLVGRVLAENIEPIGKKNQDVSPSLAAKISKLKNQVLVRSPLTCEAKNSVCQLCYGWSLAHGNLVSLGEAVGILAAQSIGEPGTQLTMRTFHTGGVFSGDVMQEIRSPFPGIVKFSSPLQGSLIRTLHGKIAFLTKMEGEFYIFNSEISDSSKYIYQIPISTVLFIRQFEKVEQRQLLAEFSSVATNNQGIQAKYNLNSEKEGQIYFENVLLVVKGGKEGDVIKTSLKFGSIWILAGKLYQSPIRSNLFIKSGDLIDTKSILNESILATPYSGFLENFNKTKEKETFFNKKINTPINQIYFLNQLLTDTKSKNLILKNYSVKQKNNFLYLKQPFSNFFIKTIHYKKLGYFISLTNLDSITFFFNNSLSNFPLEMKTICFQSFWQSKNKNKGIFSRNQKYFNAQTGPLFLLAQTFYKLENKKSLNSRENNNFLIKNISISKNKNLIFIKNSQGNKLPINSKTNKLLSLKISINSKNNSENFKFNSFYTKNKLFKFNQNPYQSLICSSLPLEDKLKKLRTTKYVYQKNFLKQCQIPKSFYREKNKIRKYRYNPTLNNFKKKDLTSLSFHREQNQTNVLTLKLQSGWVYFPKNTVKFLFFHNYFGLPGQNKNSFQFDQNFSYTKQIKIKEKLYFFSKPNCLKKIRYINNKFFRSDKFHDKSFQLKTINKKLDVGIIKNPSRNKIYINSFHLKTKVLLVTRRQQELNYLNKITKKNIYQKISNNLYSLKFYEINSFIFNKQTVTRLKLPYPSIDFKIKSNFIKQKKNTSNLSFSIYFKSLKNYPLNNGKIEIGFTKNLKFSIIRKIDTLNFLVGKNLSNEKILITKQNAIFEQTSLSLNSFLSPFSGEITSTKTDLIGKQKSLLLTNNDQISFSNDDKNCLITIGQVLRYGDPLFPKIAVHESGQIIQIDKTKITLRKAQPLLFSSQGVFHVDNGDLVEKNTPLITLFYQKLKTEDIVQGIPKIEELFEARQTKEGEPLQENLHTKLHLFFSVYKQQFSSQEAARKSIEKIQQILVNNVQKVYQSQGVSIADKHIEIIVRQMTTKVKITESGRTGLLRGELIDLEWVEVINLGIEAQNEIVQQSFSQRTEGIDLEKAEYEPIILGITKAALETESFISASSFQETTRILSRAAIERKTDFLRGLKENVILGHLIPAGTGFTLSFDPQIKTSGNISKLSWLNYTDIIKMFPK